MIKQTRGALSFLIADYKGVLKNALIASSATFFALTANATDTTIDLTASTPQTDIIVNAGDTVTLNNGKTAFPEDAPYTASKISVADGGTLKITNGGNFKVDELTVKSTNFLPTGEYYAVRPDLQDLNSDRTTITAKNATFEGGTIYHPFTIDNLIVTNNINASNASLFATSATENPIRITFEDNATGNIRDLAVDELQLKKGTKVFVKNFSHAEGADGLFAVNSDFNSNISILAIKHDGEFFIGHYPDPGVDYDNDNIYQYTGAVGANSALVLGVSSEAEAEQLLRDANLIITDTDGKTKLNEAQWKAVAYLTKPIEIKKLVVDGNNNFDAKTFATDTNNFPQTNWRALSLGENSAVFLSKDLTNSIAYSGDVSDTAAIDQITPAMNLGTAGRVYYHNSSAIILDSDTLRAGARYKIFNKDVALVNRDGRLDNSLEDSLTVKSRNGNFVTRVKVNSISKVTIDGLTIAPSTNTSSGSGTGTGDTGNAGNTTIPTNPATPSQPSNPSAGGNTSGSTEEVVEVATRNSYFNVSNALYNTFHEAHQFGTTGAGADFLSAVAGETTNGGKEAEQAARLGQLGGVYQSAFTVSSITDDIVSSRNGVGSSTGSLIVSDNNNGFGIWLSPMVKVASSDGFDSDGLSYGTRVRLTDFAIGADYTLNNGSRVGAYFHTGNGKSTGKGLASHTDGDLKYYGAGLYGKYSYNNFSLLADVSYNKITDDVDTDLGLQSYSRASASVDTYMVKAGLTGQYNFNVNTVSVIPHAGVRYTTLKSDDYSVQANGLYIANVKSDRTKVVSFPVGVTVEKAFNVGQTDWKVKPAVDLGVNFNTGDTDASYKTTFIGANEASLNAEIADSVVYTAGAGLKFSHQKNADIEAGVVYAASENTNDVTFHVNGSYQF